MEDDAVVLKQIYADFNDYAEDGTLPLTCAGSLKSIRDLPEELSDGEWVRLTDGEIILIGQVFRSSSGFWEWRPDRLENEETGWAADITNDPRRDFDLFIEITKSSVPWGAIARDESGEVVLTVYPSGEPIEIPADWLGELLSAAEKNLPK